MRPIDRAREMGWPTIVTLLESVEGKQYDEWRAAHPELAALDDDHAPGLNGSNGAGPSTPSGRSERAADDLARLTIKIDEEEYCITWVEKVGNVVTGVHWSDGDYWTRDEQELH